MVDRVEDRGPLNRVLFSIGVIVFPFAWNVVVGERIAVRDESNALRGELGIIESFTVIFLIVACVIAYRTLIALRTNEVAPKLLRIWLWLLIPGAFVFAGEEASWGQHWFGWGTPEGWQEISPRDETNLHNVMGIFDQVPRMVLTIGILIGGVLIPLYRKIRGIQLDRTGIWYWIMPTLECLPAGLLVLLFRPLWDLTGWDFLSAGEMKEFAIALFIVIYADSLRGRIYQTR